MMVMVSVMMVIWAGGGIFLLPSQVVEIGRFCRRSFQPSPVSHSRQRGPRNVSEFWQFTSIQLLDHLIRGTIHINNHLTIWWKGPATKSCRSGSAASFLLLIWETSADMRDKFLPIKSCSICRGSAKALTAFINVIRIFSHNFFWEENNSPQNQPRLILSLPLLLPASSFERP